MHLAIYFRKIFDLIKKYNLYSYILIFFKRKYLQVILSFYSEPI